MVWSAAQDRGLVVDAFSVPPEMAQTGLTGAVVANRLIDRYGRLQSASFSIVQGGESYRRDGADEVRVEIPDTGISLGELQRYLRDWLGRGVHVSGEVVRAAKGYSLTVRYGDQPGITLQGDDLDTLMGQGAEHLLAAALPYRYAEYLVRHKRFGEAQALLPSLAASGTVIDRARAYSVWSALYFYAGDMWSARRKAQEGQHVDPDNPTLFAFVGASESNLGHDEAGRAASAAVSSHFRGEAVATLDPLVAATLPVLFTIYRDEPSGDFTAALAGWARLAEMHSAYDAAAQTTDFAADHDLDAARRSVEGIAATFQGKPNFNLPLERMYVAYYTGDWAAAARFGAAANAALQNLPDQRWQSVAFAVPIWADATARSGDIAGALALIGRTPRDCDACVRARGRIAALAHDGAGAARWFALVSARAPHIPFADTDWGTMLLDRGDLDGALAKFRSAHAKGPHFADPLELWGETLMAKNRSDLALAKFAEAGKYAPHWGRLHLKWGEALYWSGRKDEAKAQLAIAQRLDLSGGEKAERAAMARRLGSAS